jgi:ABC-type spermidine/putrescine transport system permease subunit I
MVAIHAGDEGHLAIGGHGAGRTMINALRQAPRQARRRLPAFRDSLWLLAPLALLYGVFALVPFALIVRFAVADGGAPFMTVLHSSLLLRAAANTLVISLITTVLALVLAYLLAAALWRAGPRLRRVLLAFVLLPFWTAVLIKNFAWAALLQDNGLANSLLQASGLTSAPVTLLHNRLAVIVGMVHYVLPYAVFPIFNAMQAIDGAIERAARSLGAKTASVIWLIVFPLTLPGVYSAALLVFVVSIGFFITPVILGAPSDMMIANLVNYYVHELVDFNAGSALAVLILAAVVPLIIVQQSLPREGRYGAV